MSSLRRTMAAGFTLDNALTLEQLLTCSDPTTLLLSVDSYFVCHPCLTVTPEQERKLRNGMTLVMPDVPEETYRVYSPSKEFLALCVAHDGKLSTVKSFFTV